MIKDRLIITKPKAGWSELIYKEHRTDVSYVTDFPYDFLAAIKKSFEDHGTQFVTIDREGSCAYLMVTRYFELALIMENRAIELVNIQVDNRYEFAMDLIQQIEENFDAWADWHLVSLYKDENPEEELEKEKKRLSKAIEECKTVVINKIKEYVKYPHEVRHEHRKWLRDLGYYPKVQYAKDFRIFTKEEMDALWNQIKKKHSR